MDNFGKDYKFGFASNVNSQIIDKGINENIIRQISRERNEPKFVLDFRLKAYRKWLAMNEPHWANVDFNPIRYQDLYCHSMPKANDDENVINTFSKLGISLHEEDSQMQNVAIDAVFDSVSVMTTMKKKLQALGIIFCSISEAIKHYPHIIEKYMGSVVGIDDNFFASLNGAMFSDGSFAYIPKNTRCPIDLSTYFRINTKKLGQFERTLIIADEGSYVSYLEGCSASQSFDNQLHAGVVELIALQGAQIKYSTMQNWYPGDKISGKGGIYNFVTKRGKCIGDNSKISWVQTEIGSAITWKYPGCILIGDNSMCDFYSVSFTDGFMQADTGTKMIHIGKNTKSRIIAKSISADCSKNTYRSKVLISKNAANSRNYSQCNSMLVGNKCRANTEPDIEIHNDDSKTEHEASFSKIDEEQLHYVNSRGLPSEQAIQMIICGFCNEVLNLLPLEFAAEADRLLATKLTNVVG